MIYISTSCVRNETIPESVEELALAGFKNLELSGGTKYYNHETIVTDLLVLKKKYNLNYLLHNYFPPPKKDFVLNLASLNQEINAMSVSHVKDSIDMSVALGAKEFGFHAGFFLDIGTSEIGKKITTEAYKNKDEAEELFYENYLKIKEYSDEKGVKIFVENNVYSSSNFEKYGNENPLMLMTEVDYNKMNEQIDFNLLLDVAHLKVSCNTLNKDFGKELTNLSRNSDYIHISDNNSLEDSNKYVNKESVLFGQLRGIELRNKVITLEIYEPIEKIKESYELISTLI